MTLGSLGVESGRDREVERERWGGTRGEQWVGGRRERGEEIKRAERDTDGFRV